MSTTTRSPTEVAECGCPHDPEYDEGSMGWHLVECPIREAFAISRHRVKTLNRNVWFGCVEGGASEHHFKVNRYFVPNLPGGGIHMLACERCGVHLHARFECEALDEMD